MKDLHDSMPRFEGASKALHRQGAWTLALLFAGLTMLLTPLAQAAIPASERAVLIGIYNGANGDNWIINGGWKPMASSARRAPNAAGAASSATAPRAMSSRCIWRRTSSMGACPRFGI